MRATLNTFIDLIFPGRCVSCGAPLARAHNSICRECLRKIDPPAGDCGVCSGMTINGRCEICSDRKYYPSMNLVLSEYSGVMKDILHAMKFDRMRRLCVPLGRLAFGKITALGLDADMVTAVPMNRRKKWERGYNQSELIARDIAGRMKAPYRELIREMKGTGTQRSLGYRDRFINVLGRYYAVNNETVTGKTILIVDDVFTTGATLNECSRILLEMGAESVFSLTIARAGIKRLEKISPN